MADNVDAIDKEILGYLSSNARMPFLQIAKKLRISEASVRHRVKNMQENGVIKCFSTAVDPEKLGYGCVAYVGVDIHPERYLEVSKKVSDINEVRFAATSGGDHMMMLEVWARDNAEMLIINDKIKAINGVTRICPAIIKETLKSAVSISVS